jgi:hypothetical protein
MLLQMTVIHSLWLNNIVHIYHMLFIQWTPQMIA